MNPDQFDFRQIVEAARDVVMVTEAAPLDAPGPRIVYVNPAFTALTGYTREETIGGNPRMLQGGATSREALDRIRTALERGEAVRETVLNVARDGSEYWLDLSIMPLHGEDGRVTHFVAIERDVTERKRLEEKLERLSRTDPLTQVRNQRAFGDDLEREFSRFDREGAVFSMLMIDIDHFKKINDTHGHRAGDEALEQLASLMVAELRSHDLVARVGGEEFCVLLPETRLDAAAHIAERLRRRSGEMEVEAGEDTSFSLTVSIGVTEADERDGDPEEIFERADRALYDAKRGGRDQVCLRSAGDDSKEENQ
ncbi:MAG: diguanylate cyclase [Wenzhouxiangellaceae bacterium]|nr:diguanylate cyclase [Wenzhouxiangellaceae bacterium]